MRRIKIKRSGLEDIFTFSEKNIPAGSNIFLVGDTHFDHANIISLCKRPFSSIEEMNKLLVSNWNSAVMDYDVVLFLGDLVFGKDHRPSEYWLSQLNGNKYLVEGNHEERAFSYEYHKKIVLRYLGKKFLLVHDPKDTIGAKDWIIHGHHHNNNPEEFPFINGNAQTINVSVEMIGYAPLNLDKLIELDFENIEYMERIDTSPIRR